ncbi:hypothetical protein AMECASPLE_011038 [Ameca splendens]|uniref:Uncharacterized protein n=1 Tax=Ameca splendens TaxID=208324 RepID=A0ABV1A7U7_9TELE
MKRTCGLQANGSLTKALEGLRSLNNKMKDHSGVDTSMWDGFGEMFVKTEISEMYALLRPDGEPEEDDDEETSLHFPDLNPTPDDN